MKTVEDQERTQVKALKVLKLDAQELTIKDIMPKDEVNEEANNEIDRVKKIVNREQFEQFETMRYFAKNIFNSKITGSKIILMKMKVVY